MPATRLDLPQCDIARELQAGPRTWQLVEAPFLRRLSRGTRLLRLAVEEHVMFAEAAQWTDGVETWRITGDYDTSDPAVKSHGDVPDHLLQPPDPTSDSLVFDVPVAAIHRLTAWRYDDTNPELDRARYSPILGLAAPGTPHPPSMTARRHAP